MKLINTITFELEEFPDERSVEYAILSHRWEQGGSPLQTHVFQSGIEERQDYERLLQNRKVSHASSSILLLACMKYLVLRPTR